jgi:hypothetical protein
MRNVIRIAAVLFIIAMVFGCASSKSSKTTATGAAQKSTEAPSGTIHFEEWNFMAILGGDTGHGTLGYNGKVYKIKVNGMGAGGVGVQKISATGHVYHLKNIIDFPGTYGELRGGAAVVEGAGGLYLKNDKGVVIEVKTHAEGLALSVGVSGVKIQLEDKK